jgi:NH3-dependent NAD+ synthetase
MSAIVGSTELARLDRQNIQPRLRGALARSVTATLRAMLAGTGNASERGKVFYTKGGDQESDYNMLGGVPKEVVNAYLAFQLEELGWSVIHNLLETDASAELEAGQKDDNEMGPVPINDLCLQFLLGERLGMRDILKVIGQNFSEAELIAMDARANHNMLTKWVSDYVRSCMTGVHKHWQDPDSPRIGRVHIDPHRINRFPQVGSAEAFVQE